MEQVYPFGSPLKKVEQQDKSPKKVFVLGVSANAVLANWIDVDGKIIVNALPVASEPSIFWTGENAEQIINELQISPELGKLIPAEEKFNGLSNKLVEDQYLRLLGYKREDAWFFNFLPYTRLSLTRKS